ncbi:zinc finger domain-containing protein [Streptomyces cinereoruber]|uniref:zinc finger domain-containing protein n=1 Tax=Streptomyces cinereoruber TaxID=67260 RepID=UPI0036295D28
MNADEAAELLGHCSGFDNRQPSIVAAKSWASALYDVPLDDDTKAAVATYYTTPPQNPNERLWILPHHVRTLRSKIRSARLENFQYEPRPDETTGEYLARYRGQVQAIASGRFPAPTSRPQLEGGPHPRVLAELESIGWQGNRTVPDEDDSSPQPRLVDTVRRTGPLGIQCPTCSAEIGHPCKSGISTAKHPLGKPLGKPHIARRRVAAGEPAVDPARQAAEEDRIREASRLALARLQAEQDIPDAEIVEEEPASE